MLSKTERVSAVEGAYIWVQETNVKNQEASEILFYLEAKAANHSFMDTACQTVACVAGEELKCREKSL